MRLSEPLLKLPISFSAAALEKEVADLPEAAWVPHATGFPGNEAVRLVTVGGRATDAFEGPMRPTEYLQRCPYIMEIMGELAGVWGRSRLMGLGAGAEVPAHVDVHYYWRTHLRIHIPIVTNPGVVFTCGGESVHMAPGECWVFDSFRWHEVVNGGSERRVHLVLDTTPTERLWELVESARASHMEPVRLGPGSQAAKPLLFENFNSPKVMSPWEIRCHVAFIAEQAEDGPALRTLLPQRERFTDNWAALWSHFGPADEGLREYWALLSRTGQQIMRDAEAVPLKNELSFWTVLEQLVFATALFPSIQAQMAAAGNARRIAS